MAGSKRLLDRPAVGTGAVKQAAVVTLPAATPPAGREHLPTDEALISAASRHAPSRHARLHLLNGGKGPELYRKAQTFTPLKCNLVGLSWPLMMFVNVHSCILATCLSPFALQN